MYIFWRKHVHVLKKRSLQIFGCGLGYAKTALFLGERRRFCVFFAEFGVFLNVRERFLNGFHYFCTRKLLFTFHLSPFT